MIKGFKTFIMRGNVIELAVAVVMGAAFGAIVTALVNDIVTPLITAAFGKQDYSNLYWTLNKSKILYGSMVNAVLNFVLIATGVYFAIVMPINQLNIRRRKLLGLPEPKAAPTEIELLTAIRDALLAQNGPNGQDGTLGQPAQPGPQGTPGSGPASR
ncbi:MAG TPA: large conductance mechanosensitive channel protein MscL [Actinocrinis sp.]|nr:large conductance mechanosensitive channel protein MscL [Actinocrinis sp.]